MNFAIIKEISVDRMEELMPLMKECLANGQSVTFSPHGVSMLPILREGRDTVTISAPPEKLKKYDIILYQRTNGKYVLHRIVGVGETYTCIGDNQFVLEKGIARLSRCGNCAFCADGWRWLPFLAGVGFLADHRCAGTQYAVYGLRIGADLAL
jgi:hypothetical protein